MELLVDTVRQTIADCGESVYESLDVGRLAMLMLAS